MAQSTTPVRRPPNSALHAWQTEQIGYSSGATLLVGHLENDAQAAYYGGHGWAATNLVLTIRLRGADGDIFFIDTVPLSRTRIEPREVLYWEYLIPADIAWEGFGARWEWDWELT